MNKKYKTFLMYTAIAMGVSINAMQTTIADDDNEEIDHDSHAMQSKTIRGVAVTGANHRLGEPLWYLGDGLGTASFSFVFGHNEAGEEPLPLTPSSSEETVLATGLDSNFLAVLGLTADDVDATLNVPLREVAVIVNPFTGERETVSSALEAPPSAVSRAVPNDPITLGDWMGATGRAHVKCHADGTAKVRLSLQGLVEDGVYTIWGLFGLDSDGDGFEDTLVPAPFGGVPNVVVPGKLGKAQVTRTLGFCPMDEPSLKFVDVTYHSDTNVYGGTVDLFLEGFPGFAVTNTHVAFPFNVDPLH